MSAKDFILWIIFAMIVAWSLTTVWFWNGHEQIGTKSHVCFANSTCRGKEGNFALKCLRADGIDEPGICVKP